MTIKKASLEDLKAVHEIEALSFNEGSYPLFALRQFFDISSDYFLVAEEDNTILGYILGCFSSHDDQGWLLSLGVHPEARGKRLGKALTQELITLLEDHGVQEISLTVHPDNTPAINLYKDLNFEIIKSDSNYYLDNEPRLVMKKKEIILPYNT